MLISFGNGGSYEMDQNWDYQKGIELIENARNIVKEKSTIDMAILDGLNSLKNFWESNVFFSKLYGGYGMAVREPLMVLKEGLRYFTDKRRNLKFSDCEKKFQELFDNLGTYCLEEKEVQTINDINEMDKWLMDVGDSISSQEFLKYADYAVKKTKLLDRYTSGNYEKPISGQEFIIDTVQELGMSDSYIVQILYKRLAGILQRISREELSVWEDYRIRKYEIEIAQNLEMYRCIIDESLASKKELIMEYRPCAS